MKKQRTLQSITAATALALVAALLPLGATASASAHVGVRQVSPQIAAPIIVKHFWSGILRLFIPFSKHALQRMSQYRVSEATMKRVLNDGKVIYSANGVKKIRLGNVTAVVNSNTGNVITVYYAGGGGGGGGV